MIVTVTRDEQSPPYEYVFKQVFGDMHMLDLGAKGRLLVAWHGAGLADPIQAFLDAVKGCAEPPRGAGSKKPDAGSQEKDGARGA